MLVACKNLQAYFCVKLWNHSSMCLWSSPLTPFICPLTLLPGTQEGKIREQLQPKARLHLIPESSRFNNKAVSNSRGSNHRHRPRSDLALPGKRAVNREREAWIGATTC